MKKVFSLLAIAALFAVACQPQDDPNKDNNNDPKDEYTGPVQGESQWSVIGSLSVDAVKMNWDADLVLAADGDLFVLKNLKVAAADEFKIRENKDWGNNRGGDFAELNKGFEVANNGNNIKPAYEGLVDVWYNPAKEQMAVCEAGKAPAWTESAGPATAAIAIDGDFADWAALKDGTYSKYFGDEDANHPALAVVKVYADPDNIYVYFEWYTDLIAYEKDVEHVPFHCYINTDGDETTGGFADQFADACTDVLLEGFIFPDGVLGSYNPGACSWSGEPNGEGWSWADIGGEDICQGAGVEGEEKGRYEFSISREVLAGLGFPVADVFSIGFDIQQSWDSVGVLPEDAPSEDNASGKVNSLKVTTQK